MNYKCHTYLYIQNIYVQELSVSGRSCGAGKSWGAGFGLVWPQRLSGGYKGYGVRVPGTSQWPSSDTAATYNLRMFHVWNFGLRGYTWENWEELGSLRKMFTDVSRIKHVKTTEETLKTTNEMRKIHVKNEWIAYKSLMHRACITNYLRSSTHDLRMLGGN